MKTLKLLTDSRKSVFLCIALLFFLINLYSGDSYGQILTPGDDIKLDNNQKEEIVKKISELLNENYIYLETANKMEEHITSKLEKGEYNKIQSALEFSEVLTRDLVEVSKDKHLGIRFFPGLKELVEKKKEIETTKEEIEQMKYNNYGFRKVERLNGNIGYLDFRSFNPVEYGKETAVSAMNFLANCDALIIDLRNNGGGEPKMVQFICSYFFDSKPVHLNSLYYRAKDSTEEYWTLEEIPGKRMPDVDLYVLTSSRTFSGAEEFAYNLKNLKRATLIGETTGGGAHPTDMFIINDFLGILVPNGRAINPITKTNWEGTGVTPDIEVSSDNALQTAIVEAVKKLMDKEKNPEKKASLEFTLNRIKAEFNPYTLEKSSMEEYAGTYGPRVVFFEDGQLYYQREGRPKYRMIPMSRDTFMFNEIDYFLMKFERDDSNNIIAIEGIYDNGYKDKTEKTE